VSKTAFRWALLVVVVTVGGIVTAGALGVRAILAYPERAHEGRGQLVTVKVAKGMRFPEVIGELVQAGVIDRPTWFRIYAMQRGLANKVRAGTYELRDDLPPRAVLDALVKGVEEVDVQVTIPEGRNLREVIAIIAGAGIADAAELAEVARDPEWLKEEGIEGETAEGYLFPDTYRWKKPTAAQTVLETLVKHHRTVYDELRRKNLRPLEKTEKQLGWGDREVVVLASIVEKETADPAERPKVASVFLNRLTLSSFPSRRLETDPTVRYGCLMAVEKSKGCQGWDPADRLHRAQLDDADNRYNTYQHAGLPPGPIANPGRGALEAAMAPEATSYLYFVAKDEHSHVFSRTYEEHARWVAKYQK
jgi:UPF0755 protein